MIKCGTKVKTALGDMEGIVTAVCDRFEKVTYEVTYYYSGEFKSMWMAESEFTTEVVIQNKMGFK